MVRSAGSFGELESLVRELLCASAQLDPEQTPLSTSMLVRSGGRPCGLIFQVHGPRLLKGYAIWAGDEARLLLYDSAGARTDEIQLSEAPDPAELHDKCCKSL